MLPLESGRIKMTNRDYNNYKPFRTKAQKAEARKTAVLCKDGTYRSNTPVSYHAKKVRSLK